MYPLLHASVLDDTRKVYIVGLLHGFLVSFRKRQSTTLDEDKHRVFAVPNRMAASSLAYPFALHGLAACTPPHYTPESLLYSAQSRRISLLPFLLSLITCTTLMFYILLSTYVSNMGLTTAAFAAPAISLRRSDRLKKYPPLTPKMAAIQKDDVQDTYVFEDIPIMDVMTTNPQQMELFGKWHQQCDAQVGGRC